MLEKRAIGYIRVSTEEQVEHGTSIEVQRLRIREYCAHYQIALVRIYEDGGESAGSMFRPGLMRLRSDLGQRDFELVLVYKLDRLSRNNYDMQVLMKEFQSYNVELRSITEWFENQTAAGRLQLNNLAAFAQFERERIIERVSEGMQHKGKSGGFTGGPPPFGYMNVNRELVQNPAEVKVIEMMAKMVRERVSHENIAKRLNSMGITHRGKPWRESAIRRIFRSKFYVGVWWDDNRYASCKMYRGEMYPGKHKPIWDILEWTGLQRLIDANRVPADRLIQCCPTCDSELICTEDDIWYCERCRRVKIPS